jgi:hypothetical protein
VEEADVGIDPLHHLAVELEDEAQNAVGRRVLRPEVERESTDSGFHGSLGYGSLGCCSGNVMG